MDVEALTDRLHLAGCVAADEEAEELLAAAPDDVVLEAWVRRREQGEPLAWIVGTMTFCGRPVAVDPGVYVPRYQTEDLARRAVPLLPAWGRAADLATGSGAVAAHLRAEVPSATVVGIDADRQAVACARRNGVPALVGDLRRPPLRPRSFDLVTAVAPYVPTAEIRFLPADVQRYEPRAALDGGDDGLDLVRALVTSAGRLLRPCGWLLTEVGGDQADAIGPALADAGFTPPAAWYDEDGDLRGLATRRP
jgi:release factor glutamine methyltransferase